MRVACVAVLASLLTVAGCAHHDFPFFDPPDVGSLSCRQTVPEPALPLAWISPPDLDGRRRLSRWCETVGPVFYQPRSTLTSGAPIDRLAIVTWNIHEDGGDVDDLLMRLRRGDFTNGEPIVQFVLLLQEATRHDAAVPAHIPRGYPSPRSITTRRGERVTGITRFAKAGLAVLYAPSMRNGEAREEGSAEDRGNVILSTVPLLDPTLIELPLERQRRVAAAAAVEGRTTNGAKWRLQLVNVHLNTALALAHGGPFAARRRQVTALLDALRVSARPGEATVLAGDLNTWRGDGEAAVRMLSAAFPDTPSADRGPTWRGPLGVRATLDHIFVRGPVSAAHVTRLPGQFGSDHFPLLTIIRF